MDNPDAHRTRNRLAASSMREAMRGDGSNTTGGVPDDSIPAPSRTSPASVVNAAYEIIAGKGATNLAIGLSTARIVEAILGDQHRVLPVSTVQRGAYDITGVALSLPTAVCAAGADRVLEVPLSGSELAGLRASADTLMDAQRFLGLT